MTIPSLCQPDESKGCSVCCGLFNFKDITKQNLEKFLLGKYSSSQLDSVRDITSHICTFQRFLSPNRPGCSLHPSFCGIEKRNESLFGTKICNEYLCPAYFIFNMEQKIALISLISDWYLYSLAILDPESFVFIMDLIDSQRQIDEKKKKRLLAAALEFYGNILAKTNFPIFHYSLAEYNQHKIKFSLPYNNHAIGALKKHLQNYF